MVKIYQLKNKDWKSKTWYASFRDASGKRVQKCLGVTNKKEAQKVGEVYVIPKHEVDRIRTEKR